MCSAVHKSEGFYPHLKTDKRKKQNMEQQGVDSYFMPGEAGTKVEFNI